MERELLKTRDNVNCANLSKEDFVTMMHEDMKDAIKAFDDHHYNEQLASFEKHKKSHIEFIEKHAAEYAAKKWKTEKKRNEYIKKTVELEKEEQNNQTFYYYGVSFFDFDLRPDVNGISGNCTIDFEETYNKVESQLERCFNSIKDNKYWKRGLGWKLYAGGRPKVELILPADAQAEFDAEAKALADDINKFYATCHYCGD